MIRFAPIDNRAVAFEGYGMVIPRSDGGDGISVVHVCLWSGFPPRDGTVVAFEGYGVVTPRGDGGDAGKTVGDGGLALVMATPCDDSAVCLEGYGMVIPSSDGNDAG